MRASIGAVRSVRVSVRAGGRRSFASSSSDPPVATPGFTGTATAKAGKPLLTDNESVYAWRHVLEANQRAYNAAHYPATPVPATYRTLTRVSNVLVDAVWVVAFVAMGAAMSTGIWAPVRHTNKQHTTAD